MNNAKSIFFSSAADWLIHLMQKKKKKRKKKSLSKAKMIFAS